MWSFYTLHHMFKCRDRAEGAWEICTYIQGAIAITGKSPPIEPNNRECGLGLRETVEFSRKKQQDLHFQVDFSRQEKNNCSDVLRKNNFLLKSKQKKKKIIFPNSL